MKRVIITLAIAMLLVGPLISSALEQPATATTSPRMLSISEDSTAWRRDPFLGGARKAGLAAMSGGARLTLTDPALRADEINLQGILRSDKHYLALINGRTVKAGDRIGSVTIKRISRYQVVVRNGAKEESIYDIYQGRIDRGKR